MPGHCWAQLYKQDEGRAETVVVMDPCCLSADSLVYPSVMAGHIEQSSAVDEIED